MGISPLQKCRITERQNLTPLQHVRKSLPHSPHPPHPHLHPLRHRTTHTQTQRLSRKRPPLRENLLLRNRPLRRFESRHNCHNNHPRHAFQLHQIRPRSRQTRHRRETIRAQLIPSPAANRHLPIHRQTNLRLPEPKMGRGFPDCEKTH